MKRSEIKALKLCHTKLTRQRKRAQRYLEQHGKGGSIDTLYKNEALIHEADVEIPLIEEKLRTAWD
jgi:Fe2+ or Zn2+ uptake regulation protein